jgi:hypothetical protein
MVRLSAADAPGQGPYQPARVQIENRGKDIVDTVQIASAGAPTVIALAVVLPGQKAELTLLLPAISRQQSYQVRLVGGGRELASEKATVAWPADRVKAEAFHDEAVALITESKADWPPGLRAKATVLVGLLVALGLLCGVLRGPWAGGLAIVLISGMLTWSMWGLLKSRPVYELRFCQIESARPAAESKAKSASSASAPTSAATTTSSPAMVAPEVEDVIVVQALRSVDDVRLSYLCYPVSSSAVLPAVTIEPQTQRTHLRLQAGEICALKMAEP